VFKHRKTINKGAKLQGREVIRVQSYKAKKLKSFRKNEKKLYPPSEKMIDFPWADPRVYYIITQRL